MKSPGKSETGTVYLIGSGPGDPGLLTLKGQSLLKKADVVIYDNLVNSELLNWVPEHTERIYVGKKAGQHTLRQEKINQLLIEKAQTRAVVVRLKGGDPYIFGRGGEEALALWEAGIPFEVVPGITAGAAALNYAGIPATLRGMDASLTFVTGHEDPAKENSDINWKALAAEKSTLVFYMGVGQLPKITAQLITHGKSPQTPAAVIRNGTLPDQNVLVGTLETISDRAKAVRLAPPALIVVGEVVNLREKLSWFEKKPLFGKRILVTRAQGQAGSLADLLREQGAAAIVLPAIEIVDPESWKSADEVLAHPERIDWLVFTSANGVKRWMQRLFDSGVDVRALGKIQIASIGAATSEALKNYGLIPDLQPASFIAEGLIEAFQTVSLKNKTVVLARAEAARDVLPETLKQMGAIVTVAPVYRTILNSRSREMAAHLFEKPAAFPDWITFTSSSTVEKFVQLIGAEKIPQVASAVKTACIGPITQKTAERFGFHTTVMPKQFLIPDLVKALVSYEMGAKTRKFQKGKIT